ncbi:MAG: hypothetical protein J0L94_06065 [Rhodothermia bacterium]|nr:hypothetical protein [Rhodothermia bacterium]
MPKFFIIVFVLFCASHPRLLAQCEHIIQPTQKEIDEGYAQMSSDFVRTVLSLFVKDKAPISDRFPDDQVRPRFVDHKRLTKPGSDFYGDKLFHDTPPCWEGTLPTKKRIAKRILQEANKLGAYYIDSRNEEQTLERINVLKPNYNEKTFLEKPSNFKDFFDSVKFAYLILGIPRKGGPYSNDHRINRRDIFPTAWTMRVTEVSEQTIVYYDVMLHEIEPKKWAILDVEKIAGYHFDFPLK